MKTTGRHLIAEYLGCDASILDDLGIIENLLIEAAHAANTRVVSSLIKPFNPQGVSGVVVIEESHLSVHTWPEKRYAAVDFFTCGQGNPLEAHRVLYAGLQAMDCECLLLERGNITSSHCIRELDRFPNRELFIGHDEILL